MTERIGGRQPDANRFILPVRDLEKGEAAKKPAEVTMNRKTSWRGDSRTLLAMNPSEIS